MDNYYRLNLENKILPWSSELLNKLEKHSHWTFEHSIRVGIISENIAKKIQLSNSIQNKLLHAGLLHDIGKVYISKQILNSPQKLNLREKKEIEKHVEKGYLMIKNFDLQIAEIIGAHHTFQENSYPKQNFYTKNDNDIIHLQKILALADVIDSLMSDRPYKKAITENETYFYLKNRYDSFLLNYAILQRQKLPF